MISESTLKACDDLVRVDGHLEVLPKGVRRPITIYEIGGICGEYDVFLPAKVDIEPTPIANPIAVTFVIIEGKQTGNSEIPGTLTAIAEKTAIIETEEKIPCLSNLKITLLDEKGVAVTTEAYEPWWRWHRTRKWGQGL